MRLFAPSMVTPPAGCTVRTVIDGVERTHTTTEGSVNNAQEQAMPRGVYERKKKPAAEDQAEPRKAKYKPRAASHTEQGMGDVLATLYSKRDALNAAIAALEGLST